MLIGRLDHVNLRTTRLDEMVAWYEAVIGLRSGDRPNFGFPGAWLYAGDAAAVHLVGIKGGEAVGSEKQLKLEHFAFTATGAAEFEARLTSRGEPYRRTQSAETGITAFNLWDPDGNHIHVDFNDPA